MNSRGRSPWKIEQRINHIPERDEYIGVLNEHEIDFGKKYLF
jgi:hypothetical protein